MPAACSTLDSSPSTSSRSWRKDTMDLCQAGRAVRRMRFTRNVDHETAPQAMTSEAKLERARVAPEAEVTAPAPPSRLGSCAGGPGVVPAGAMTARGTPSRFLTSVLHNGLGRYVQQLQRLSFTLSRDGPSSRGAREFVEQAAIDFARRNPGVVLYVNPRPCCVPRVVAEYLNGAVREETLHGKSVEEIDALVHKLAARSGLDIIRIRKPFHTDSPSIQGQWHPFTNKAPSAGGLRPREPPTAAQEP